MRLTIFSCAYFPYMHSLVKYLVKALLIILIEMPVFLRVLCVLYIFWVQDPCQISELKIFYPRLWHIKCFDFDKVQFIGVILYRSGSNQ